MLRKYQNVVLKVDSYKDEFCGELVEIKKGQRGSVVDVLIVPNKPVGYNVDFIDDEDEPVAVFAMEEQYLSPVPEPPGGGISRRNAVNTRRRKRRRPAA
jgi:hypothetical protein